MIELLVISGFIDGHSYEFYIFTLKHCSLWDEILSHGLFKPYKMKQQIDSHINLQMYITIGNFFTINPNVHAVKCLSEYFKAKFI